MTDAGPQDPVIEPPAPERATRRLSAVWLVPVGALLVSLAVAWTTYAARGPVIEIVLEDAAGVVADQTALRFRNVDIGTVEDLRFTEDLGSVIVTARVEKEMARYLDQDAQFWVVRPSVSPQGVTGIETVISGVYIEAYWDDEPGPRAARFDALPRPPLTPADQPGLRIALRAPHGGSIAVGAPLLYKRIPVGRVESVELDAAGDVVIAAFINEPYDAFVTSGTRFWNASGFSIELGAAGASLNVESLLSLLQGGVSFDQVGSGMEPGGQDQVFELYASEADARRNVIEDLPGARLTLNAFFDASVGGLEPGAPVEFRGLTAGEVTALQPVVQPGPGGPRVRMRVTMEIAPQRLGVSPEAEDPEAAGLALLADLVEGGLRAQLATSGLLSRTLYVNLAETPEAAPATLQREAEPYPVIPTAPPDVSGVAASAENVMNRLAELPIEELMDAATTLLANVNALVSDESVRAAPENLGLLLADLRDIVATSGIRETPAQIAAVLASIKGVVDEVRTRELLASLASTLETARATVARFGVAAEGVPELVSEARALTEEARALPLDAFVASAARTVEGIDALVRSEDVAALPASVEAALAEARAVIAELRAGGAVENVTAATASLRALTDELQAAGLGAAITEAVAAAEAAAANVNDATEGLPALVENLRALSDEAARLPLDQLVTEATALLDAAEGLLGAEGLERLPDELAQALAEVRQLAAELREGGAVNNLNATLASADQAAAAVAAATAELPALVDQLNAVAARADAALATITPGAELNREAQAALRDIRSAAQAFDALVVALERRPNSVLFGR